MCLFKKLCVLIVVFISVLVFANQKGLCRDKTSPLYRDPSTRIEQRVEDLLKRLSLEEKVLMCQGGGMGSFKGVPRLGVPNIYCVDGPRGPHGGENTAFGCGVALGSTWNPSLLKDIGTVMGKEARAKGKTVLLGPGINILRDPLGGRFFEYYTEDPYLNAELTVAIVKGIQSQDVAACLKHYICNNRERNRNFYKSQVDERTLREIYLPGFKAGVQRGGAWAIMTSANGVNKDFVSDSHYLLTDILKNEYGFDGIILTDWLRTRSLEKAAFAGLDVSMPYNEDSLFGKSLLQAVRDGRIPEHIIDEKARRVIRTIARVGLLDGSGQDLGGVENTRRHQHIALQSAQEGIVLLKNQNILPLDKKKIKKIVVLGPSSDRHFCQVGFGGSSWVNPPYEITPLKGIEAICGSDVQVEHLSLEDMWGFQVIGPEYFVLDDGTKGIEAQYFSGNDNWQNPALKRIESNIDFMWEMRSPDLQKVPKDHFNADFITNIVAPVSGEYILRITADDQAWLYQEKHPVLPIAASSGLKTDIVSLSLQAGKPQTIRLRYSEHTADAMVRLEWSVPKTNTDGLEKKLERLKDADAVIFCGGIDHSRDTEGHDREDMAFPAEQQRIINKISTYNKNVIVVLVNGSPMELGGWIDSVPAVIESWYGGMEAGTATAKTIFGQNNPSGKLPFTWPKKLKDSPVYAIATQDNEQVHYQEGIFVGYRYFLSEDIEPQFPFGFGLSYTTFDYSDLKVTKMGQVFQVKLIVKNTGSYRGAEVVQLYVHDKKPAVRRPVRELKGFRKVRLEPGQSKSVDFSLDNSTFAYYDITSKSWRADAGEFEIQIGSSSRDIKLHKTICLDSGM